MNFQTPIQEVSIANYPPVGDLVAGDDYEIEVRPFTLSWNCELETREWGVKDISWYPTNIEGQFEVVYFDENGDELRTEVVDFDFQPFKDKTEMDVEMEERSISPNEIDIDYADMTLSVR